MDMLRTMRLTTGAALALATLASLVAAGCGNSSTAATAPTTATGPVTENVSGALTVGGLSSHTFNAFTAGTIAVTLTSVSTPSTVVGLGVGVYNSVTFVCSLTTSLNTTAGTTAQISVPVDIGTYCVEVYDVGKLAAPTGFAISIVHP